MARGAWFGLGNSLFSGGQRSVAALKGCGGWHGDPRVGSHCCLPQCLIWRCGFAISGRGGRDVVSRLAES
jgi:hypothetical protein